jgi:cation diffusion facilitator CzcD-associated flavoprotein CzcO
MDLRHEVSKHAIGIIGAGFGGIMAAMDLKAKGRTDFVIFERADSIGGTWRDNIYPGCACDVPSHVYSLAKAPNPNWSRMYSAQPEILAYMHRIVDEYQLEQHIQYGAEIIDAKFIAEMGEWELMDKRGQTHVVKVVVAALGPLNRPVFPKIPGLETFAGKAFHSSQWDPEVDWNGKKVAIIGTGASAIQIVPAIAKDVAQLDVFQRTAAWISPRNDHPIAGFSKKLFNALPFLQRGMRHLIFEIMEVRGKLFLGNQFLHRLVTKQSLKKLAREVKDPETRKKLTPDYKLGCKRILSSDDYLPSFNLPQVKLHTDRIIGVEAEGLRTEDGKLHPADIVIYCTGFQAAEIVGELKVHGLEGKELFDEWSRNGMEAHYGTTFSGYPNFTYLLGPNTGLGHSSVLHIMESQMPYILEYLDHLDKQGPKGYLDVKPSSQADYNRQLQEKFQGTVWASGCKSWYLNSKGKNTTLYPRLSRTFRRQLQHFDAGSYLAGKG